VGLGALYVSNGTKEKQLATLHDELQKAHETREQLEQLQGQAKAQQDEIATLRQDKQELLRLRSEVIKLRDSATQLEKKSLQAQSELQRAQSQIQSAQAGAQQAVEENSRLRNAAAQNQANAQRIACANNIRQLDNAKQQWAQLQNRTAEAVPTAQDLAPFFNNAFPTCPAGGTYTLNAVGQETSCSIPGHAISK